MQSFSKLKRAVSMLVVLSLSLVTLGQATFAQAMAAASFTDVSAEQPNVQAINYLKSQGVIQGYGDGSFLPDSTINRAEFMKIVIAATVKDPVGSGCFTDVHDEWFAKYICEGKKRGLVSGYADGSFKPGLNINLAEGSKIMTNAFAIKDEGVSVNKNDPWYKIFVASLEEKKAIPVSIDYPEKKITRGEMSEMAWRIKASVTNKPTKTFASLTSPLPMISSCAELGEKFALQNYRMNVGIRPLSMAMNNVSAAPEAPTAAAPAPAPSASESKAADTSLSDNASQDFSSTNVQVAGVDEADIVKNDANYVYLIKGRSIRIVKASPVSDMKEVSRVTVDSTSFYPTEMYVTGDKLVVVGSNYDSGTKTEVHIFDITDRANVKKFRDFSFDGNYVSSRRIGNYAYFVMNDYPNYYGIMQGMKMQTGTASDIGASAGASALVPTFTDSKDGKPQPVVPCDQIRIFPRYEEPNIMIVAGIPLNDGNAATVRQAFLGSGSTIYSSLESLYVATTKYQYNDMTAYNIWAPAQRHDSTESPITKESSVFYRFALKDGSVEYKTTGEVEGRLLNQFSMDEQGADFRVATTKGDFWSGNIENQQTNQLYILDKDNLGTVLGKVDDIGKGEKIKSVRFMGSRAYVVTFKNTDPFFVINVANSRAPKILGELKLPGYSDYLHPYDENHLIGFGKDAVDASDFPQEGDAFMPNRDNFAWYQGMKIAMFDVTDPTAPKEMFHEAIGDRGTNSELLYNHKALLFDKAKGLIAFPIEIAEIKDKATAKIDPGTYGEITFRGAVVYNVDLVKGFTLKGKITHVDTDAMIKRLIYIGNNIYAISMKKVTANSLTDMSAQGSAALADEPAGEGGGGVIMY